MMDDKAMMLAVKAGEINYLAQLFEKYHVALINYFIRMGNAKPLSEDLVQETFMRVLNYKSSYEGKHQFSSWLYRIAKNTAIDHHRKPGHRQANLHDDYDDQQVSDDQHLTDHIQRSQQQQHFDQAMAALSSDQRELIVLSRYQQLKYEEIAELLDCNLNTIKTRMRAAMRDLKQHYDLCSGASV